MRDIRRATRRQFSAEDTIRIVVNGLRGGESAAEFCRREGIASFMYYGWSKSCLEVGKSRMASDAVRAATSNGLNVLDDVTQLCLRAFSDTRFRAGA